MRKARGTWLGVRGHVRTPGPGLRGRVWAMVQRVVLQGDQITDYEDGRGNTIRGTPTADANAKVIFEGENCHVSFGKNTRFRGGMTLRFSDCRVEIGDYSQALIGLEISNGANLLYGERIRMTGIARIVIADGATVTVGDRCLFAQDIALRAYDNHPIYDLRTRDRTNYARDITVGSDVWVGNSVTMTGGASVGHGSIIGTKSMVTGSRPVGEHCVAVGSPAKVVKKFAAWQHQGMPPADRMDEGHHADCLARLESDPDY